MSKLIAFVDGSVYWESVCDHAAWVAGKTGLPIEVLHVLGRRETSSVPVNLSGNITLGARTALLDELAAHDEQRAKLAQQRGRAILDDARARLAENGIDNVTSRLRIDDIVDTVAECEADAEILLIGKRGEGADFAKLHLGSNLERIARSTSKPLLVTSRAFQPIDRFVIAFDGRASSVRAVQYVAASPLFKGLTCHLLTVGGDSADQRALIDEAVTKLDAAGHSAIVERLPGDAEKVIPDYVADKAIGLLVMGAYGHTRLKSLFLGSTTTEMIRSCKIPILLFR
ncbi:MAG: universal stress protein [Sphingomonadales bacterium]